MPTIDIRLKFDIADYIWLLQFGAYVHTDPKGYQSAHFMVGPHQGKHVTRLLLNTPEDMIADHINRDSLDCRRHNLRNVTYQ